MRLVTYRKHFYYKWWKSPKDFFMCLFDLVKHCFLIKVTLSMTLKVVSLLTYNRSSPVAEVSNWFAGVFVWIRTILVERILLTGLLFRRRSDWLLLFRKWLAWILQPKSLLGTKDNGILKVLQYEPPWTQMDFKKYHGGKEIIKQVFPTISGKLTLIV